MSADMIFPVYGFSSACRKETVATFFDWSSAADFAMQPLKRDGFEKRNLYLAEPRFDRRATGYRPATPLVEFEEIKPGRIAA